MAAGDVLLDDEGRVMLDDEGRVILSNGVGDECCCGEPGPCDTPCGCEDVSAFHIVWENGNETIGWTVDRISPTLYRSAGSEAVLECIGGKWRLSLTHGEGGTCSLVFDFCAIANGCPADGEDPRAVVDDDAGYQLIEDTCDWITPSFTVIVS